MPMSRMKCFKGSIQNEASGNVSFFEFGLWVLLGLQVILVIDHPNKKHIGPFSTATCGLEESGEIRNTRPPPPGLPSNGIISTWARNPKS